MEDRNHTLQVFGSLLVAAIIIAIAIAVVTASIPAGGLDDDGRRRDRSERDHSGPG